MKSSDNNILHINKDMLFDFDNLTPFFGRVNPYPYPDMKEDLIYVSTYIKGKSKKNKDFRILVVGVETGNKYFMFPKEDFGGTFLCFIELSHFNQINEEHYKFKSYNYYFFRENRDDLNIILNMWIENNPKPFEYSSYKNDKIHNYTYIFEYNGNRY